MLRKETVTIEDSEMDVWITEPDGNGPFPGLVIAMHAPAHIGIENDPFQVDILERYASAGYVCVAPFLYHRLPLTDSLEDKSAQMRDDHLVMDIEAAVSILEGMDSVDNERTGILGHCMGGRVAWLAACHIDTFKAAVVLYGGAIKVARGELGVPPIELAANIPCPVLGLFGNDDQNPSPDDVDDYETALIEADIDYAFHRYDGAGHAFQDFNRPERHNKKASDDARAKILGFLHERLKAGQ